jgi:hypothetical protein
MREHAKLAALIDVGLQIAHKAGHVDDAAWNAARFQGCSPQELTEVFVCVALTLIVDYFAAFAETPLDVPEPEVMRSGGATSDTAA